MPLTGPCVYCGSYRYAYAAYIKSNGVLGARYVCRECGHCDDIKRVDFVKTGISKSTEIEKEKRIEMLRAKDKWLRSIHADTKLIKEDTCSD